jgi:CRP-like cAMP-binding protein
MRHTLPNDIRSLRKSALFQGCSKRQLRDFRRFGTVVDLPPGRTLDHCHLAGEQLVVVLAGEILASTRDHGTRTLHPGDWCGTVHDHQLSIDAHAVETVTAATIFVLSGRELRSLCAACPTIRAQLFDDALVRGTGASGTSIARMLSPA